MARYENRVQLVLALLIGMLLVANLLTLSLMALTPATRAVRAPILFIIFVVTFFVSVPCIVLLPRWLLRPYRRLIDEAARAPVAVRPQATRDEAEFVLETFQEVVAKLHAQQRELERMSAEAGARAASAEQFSERIVASIPSGLIAFNSDGAATVVNAPARMLLSILDDAERGSHFGLLLRVAPDLAEMVGKCLRSGEIYRREEVTATSPSGQVRRIGVTVAPIDPRLNPLHDSPHSTPPGRGALCLLTDLTEVVQLREAVTLKRNLESLGEMSAGLAHEFKNSLATLHGYAQLLQSFELDGRSRESAAALLHEVRSLSEMVTAFLNFARPQTLALEDVSLRDLIDECQSELQSFFAERHVSFAVAGEFPDVSADERMLRQAMLNLLRNAAEAVDADAARREVDVRGSIERDEHGARRWAQIAVSDTGTGIAEQDLQRVFIPFFTTKTKGHGVGLALAHRVITEHGGTLTASNATTGGAVFSIRLPIEHYS
ncbi:MAG: ATP-binding protein [Acidobacteriota bacterium]|nr:ATP-binding protein [Acidobacteriota bacterium]